MSVLYPLTLRKDYTPLKTRIRNSVSKFLFFTLIICFSIQGVFAQDSKEIQSRKEAELKGQEAAQLEAKLKANPAYRQRVAAANKLNQPNLQLTEAEEKKIAIEKANIEAKKIAEDRKQLSLPGVEYKVSTNNQGQVEYIVTHAGNVIYRQQIISSANLYDRKVQAEKEAIYVSNTLRRNLNYPIDALKAEIRSLANQGSSSRQSSNSRVTLDYTFNGSGGSIPGGAPTTTSGPASPYPATIAVSGVPVGALVKTVTISGMNHTYSDDIDIVLQSPTGVNVILMSDVGLSDNLVGHNYTFSDGAALSLDDNTALASGTYKPTNFVTGDNWTAPGPGTAPTSTTLSTFGSGDHNGTWNLFILDDVGGDVGDWASWEIVFTDPPTVCFPINLTGHPANTTVCSGTTASFTVVATPAGVSYNWQVNTGSGFTYLSNGGVYSGVDAATLNITGATVAMSGYQYRVVITCSQGGLPEISNPATLTVSLSPAGPVISPMAASICPGGSVAINFVPNAQLYSAPGPITITTASSGSVSPYPSILSISGLPAGATVKQVILNGLSHTWPSDLDIVLQSPTGTNVILLSDRGGSTDAVNATLTFDDLAAGLVSNTAIVSGTFRPTNTAGPDAWPAPGPASFSQVNPTLSTFTGNFNGTWNLFVNDQAGGDGGSITSWSIIFNVPAGGPTTATFSPVTGLFTDALLTTAYTGTPVSTVYASPSTTTVYSATVSDGTCTSAPTNTTITVNTVPSITAQPGNGDACAGGTKTLSVTATGSALTYQWQVNPGSGFVNISNGFIYSGATTATLTINDVMQTMNGYRYRVVVSGACTPAVTSSEVTLAVSNVPAISVVSSSACAPTTLTASGATTYSWSPSAGLSGTTGATVTANPIANTIYTVTGTTNGCSNSTQVDVKFTPGVPTVVPAAPIICQGTIQALSVAAPPPGVTVSSGPINVTIPDDDPVTGANHPLTVSGFVGTVQSITVTFNISHPWDSDLDINLVAPNGNILNLVGARGGSGDNFTNTTISSASTTSLGTGTAPFTGTFAADGNIGWGPSTYLSNVSSFASLFSVPNGTWRLAMADFGFGDVGTLTSWSITINAVPPPTAGVWTPITGLFSDAAGTTPYVAGTPAATVYANPAATTTYSVTLTNSSTETRTFSTGGSVTIAGVAPASTAAGAGAPYPSTIAVSGLPTNAVIKSVTVKGIRHSWSEDIDMLLQSPTGTNVVLMSDVGSNGILSNVSYTFDDAGGAMSTAAGNGTGTYRPTNNGSADTYPAPLGSITQATPALSLFTGDPNGVWNLYIADDAGGDIGSTTSWEITFTIPGPTNCTSEPRTVTLTVNTPIVFTTQPQNRTACQNGSVTFTAAATGTITTTQWEVSTNGGTTWAAIPGATTTTLTLTNVQPSQNGYRYRLVLSSAGCGPTTSASATLTVNPLPTVSLGLNPGGQTELRPGMVTTLTVSSTPAGATYQWFLNGVAQPSITGASYAVDAYHLGTYTVRVTDVNGCANTTAGVTFTALPTTNLFVYPNPTNGAFSVTYYMPHASTPITITVLDMNGKRIVERHEVTNAPYTRFDFSSSKLGAGVYIIEFRNSKGALLESKQLVVTR